MTKRPHCHLTCKSTKTLWRTNCILLDPDVVVFYFGFHCSSPLVTWRQTKLPPDLTPMTVAIMSWEKQVPRIVGTLWADREETMQSQSITSTLDFSMILGLGKDFLSFRDFRPAVDWSDRLSESLWRDLLSIGLLILCPEVKAFNFRGVVGSQKLTSPSFRFQIRLCPFLFEAV